MVVQSPHRQVPGPTLYTATLVLKAIWTELQSGEKQERTTGTTQATEISQAPPGMDCGITPLGSPWALWKQNINGGEPQKIGLDGTPMSCAWSPEVSDHTLACLVQKGGSLQLVAAQALFDETPQILAALDELGEKSQGDLAKGIPEVLCWLNDGIYLRGRSFIWWFDRSARTVRSVINYAELEARNISIRSDGKKIVYNSADEIWTADLDGGNRRQETRDRNRDFNPRWIRREGEWRVIYSSNRLGQLDLWELSPGSGNPTQLINRGSDEVRIEDCAPDGSMIICRVIRNEANLWTLDPQRMKSDSPLTTSVLSDFAPTIALGSSLVAFQRLKTQLIQGSGLVDTEIYLAEIDALRLRNLRQVVELGSAPLLSPDGRWLAYLLHRKNHGNLELRLKDLQTSQEKLVSESIRMTEVSDVPRDWGPKSAAWSADSSALFYSEMHNEDRMTLKKLPVNAGLASADALIAVIGDPGDQIRDPTPSSDGSSIAYCIMKTAVPPTWEIHTLQSAHTHERPLFSDPDSFRLYCLGWYGQRILALRKYRPNRRGDSSARVEILAIDPDRTITSIGAQDRAYAQTALLDRANGVIYLTVVENEIPNIKAFHIASRTSAMVTENQREDTYLTGLQTCAAGRLFYSQHKYMSDIYRMSFERK